MAVTIFEELQDRLGPERVPDSVRRTLERRVRVWRAINGPGGAAGPSRDPIRWIDPRLVYLNAAGGVITMTLPGDPPGWRSP